MPNNSVDTLDPGRPVVVCKAFRIDAGVCRGSAGFLGSTGAVSLAAVLVIF